MTTEQACFYVLDALQAHNILMGSVLAVLSMLILLDIGLGLWLMRRKQ